MSSQAASPSFWIVVTGLLLVPSAWLHARASPQELAPGQEVQARLEGGTVHQYRVRLGEHDHFEAWVDQLSLDVRITLHVPGSSEPWYVDDIDSSRGRERVGAVAGESGDARIDIRAFDSTAAAGTYVVKLASRRRATDLDRLRARAQAAIYSGAKPPYRGGASALHGRLSRIQEVLLYRQALGGEVEARVLLALARVQDERGEKRPALAILDQALALVQGSGERKLEALALLRRGGIHDELGESRRALEDLLPAQRIYGELDDRHGLGKTLVAIASAHDNIGNKAKALELYERGLFACVALGDGFCQAVVHNNVARIASEQGRPTEALEEYEQSLALWRARGVRRFEALALTNMGAVHEKRGEPQKALELYLLSVPIRRETGDQLGEATTLHNAAAVYAVIGEPQQALELYRQAVRIWRQNGHRRNETISLSNLAKLYADLGAHERALELYQEILPLQVELAERSGEAQTRNNLARELHRLGRGVEAFDHLNQALVLWRELGARRRIGVGLANLGSFHLERGHPELALPALREALGLKREADDRRGQGTTLHEIGRAHFRLGELVEARAHFDRALELRRETKDQLGAAATLHQLARLDRHEDRLAAARARIEEGLKVMEAWRTKILSPRLRLSLRSAKQRYYDFYVQLLMDLAARRGERSLEEEALLVSERYRDQVLREARQAARIDLYDGARPELGPEGEALRERVAVAKQERERLLGDRRSREGLESAEARLADLLDRLRELEVRTQKERGVDFVRSAPLDLEQMRRALDPGTVLLEYHLGEERSFLWVVTPTSLESHELAPRAQIEAASRAFWEAAVASRHIAGRLAFEQAGRRMGEMLRVPAMGRDVGRLLVVSDGVLAVLPFGLLPQAGVEGIYEPLVTRYELVSSSSASALTAPNRPAHPQEGLRSLAILADPVLEKDDPRLAGRRPVVGATSAPRGDGPGPFWLEGLGGPALQRLPYTLEEATAIRKSVPASRALVALGFDANRDLVQGEVLRDYGILHFATHGFANFRHPELSGLALSRFDEEGHEIDGFLSTHDIYGLDLNGSLVVLSACQTGLGRDVSGEGLLGLTRGFLSAGASAVVSSLWQVDDRATAVLMERFYRAMFDQGQPPSAALRTAQVSMWREPVWHSPFYWAGFVFHGDWRAQPTSPASE